MLYPFMPGGLGDTLKHTHLFDGTLTLPAASALSGTGTAFYYGSWSGTDSLGYAPSNLNSVLNTTTSYFRTEIIITSGASPTGDVNSGTYTDATDVYSWGTSANDMPGGRGNKYTMTQLKRTPAEWNAQSTPQMWMGIVGRDQWSTNQIPDLCYSYQVRVPSNLADIMDRRAGFSEWFETFFIKSNSNNNLTDSRIAVTWHRDVTTRAFSWRILFDLFVKDLYGTTLTSANSLWSYNSEPGTLVAGHAYQVDLYFAPPTSKTDMTGKAQLLITDLTDNTLAYAITIKGVVMMGYNEHNYAKIAFGGLYTGGFPPSGTIALEYGNFIIKQCPGGILRESAYPSKDVISLAPFYCPMNGTLEVDVPGTSIVPVFTRASTVSFTSADGNTVTLPVNAVRMRGYRVVVNMLAATATLATQGVTTEAKTYTLSFYGTGSVAFSGTYAGADLVGKSGASNRVYRTFTATAGTLTLTVTGSVTSAQLEDVTGLVDQSPSDYVSKGTLTNPYHGAGVDGVKYFSTYKDGSAIPASDLIGAEITPATESLSYVAGYDTARGAMMAVVTKDDWSTGNGAVIGSSTRGLHTTSSTGGVTALDGTNTATGPSVTPSGKMVIGLRWSGGKMQVFSNGQFGTETNYDGNFNLTNFVLMAGCAGVLGKTMFYARYLSDEEILYAYSELIR